MPLGDWFSYLIRSEEKRREKKIVFFLTFFCEIEKDESQRLSSSLRSRLASGKEIEEEIARAQRSRGGKEQGSKEACQGSLLPQRLW